jgi:hypothetical protein
MITMEANESRSWLNAHDDEAQVLDQIKVDVNLQTRIARDGHQEDPNNVS